MHRVSMIANRWESLRFKSGGNCFSIAGRNGGLWGIHIPRCRHRRCDAQSPTEGAAVQPQDHGEKRWPAD